MRKNPEEKKKTHFNGDLINCTDCSMEAIVLGKIDKINFQWKQLEFKARN